MTSGIVGAERGFPVGNCARALYEFVPAFVTVQINSTLQEPQAGVAIRDRDDID